MNDLNNISYKYHLSQEVYFLYKNYPKKGIIDEINISLKLEYNNYTSAYLKPIIKYKINEKWYFENEIWKDKKEFQKWIDNNLCYTKFIDTKENFCKWNNKKVFLLSVIERINNQHPWKKKKIAQIFYIDENNQGYFRYVLYENIKDIVYEKTYLDNTKYGLEKTYGTNYIEDEIYNFVNYDGIKI